MATLTQRPTDQECFDYHRDYVALVPDGDIIATLDAQWHAFSALLKVIPEHQAQVIHPPYGWTVRQVIEHCVDAERVFGYRAMRFAAGDPTDLPGWDESHYAACGYGPSATIAELADEYAALRQANVALLKRLSNDAWNRIGTADGRQVSVRTLAWLMAGHWLHHERKLLERLGL